MGFCVLSGERMLCWARDNLVLVIFRLLVLSLASAN